MKGPPAARPLPDLPQVIDHDKQEAAAFTSTFVQFDCHTSHKRDLVTIRQSRLWRDIVCSTQIDGGFGLVEAISVKQADSPCESALTTCTNLINECPSQKWCEEVDFDIGIFSRMDLFLS